MSKKKIAVIASAVFILILAITITVCVFIATNNEKKNLTNLNEDHNSEQSPSDTEDNTPEEFDVLFFNDDGSLLKACRVPKGDAVSCPGTPTIMQGYVFAGWDTDLSSVESNLFVRPLKKEISNEKTVFAISNGYGITGDTIKLPLVLAGKVDVCCFELKIHYDPSALKFTEAKDTDDYVIINHDETNGILYLNYITSANTTGLVDLCDLMFSVISSQTQITTVDISVLTAAKVLENDTFENIEYDIIHSEVQIVGAVEK